MVLRVLARTLTDLAKEREPERLFEEETGAVFEQLLAEIADAVVSFAVLVTTSVSANAESAEERLASQLRQAEGTRDKLAELLYAEAGRDPQRWQLLGALLTEVNRILDEMNTEHRTRRLFEELDRHSREQRERLPRLTRMRDRMSVPDRLRRDRRATSGRQR